MQLIITILLVFDATLQLMNFTIKPHLYSVYEIMPIESFIEIRSERCDRHIFCLQTQLTMLCEYLNNATIACWKSVNIPHYKVYRPVLCAFV